MLGIGFPEMVVITIVALIVVGPEKLPELARTAAKTITDLKRSAEGLKATIREESGVGEIIDEIRPELETTAKALQGELHDLSDISSLLEKRGKIIPKEGENNEVEQKWTHIKETEGNSTAKNSSAENITNEQDNATTQS